MARCDRCGKTSITISSTLGFCADCIRQHPDETLLPPVESLACQRNHQTRKVVASALCASMPAVWERASEDTADCGR